MNSSPLSTQLEPLPEQQDQEALDTVDESLKPDSNENRYILQEPIRRGTGEFNYNNNKSSFLQHAALNHQMIVRGIQVSVDGVQNSDGIFSSDNSPSVGGHHTNL